MITKEFVVDGTLTVSLTKKVKVTFDETDEDFVDEEGNVDMDAVKDAAIDMASSAFKGVESFCGNGGFDKLIGVRNSDESITPDGTPEFTEAREV